MAYSGTQHVITRSNLSGKNIHLAQKVKQHKSRERGKLKSWVCKHNEKTKNAEMKADIVVANDTSRAFASSISAAAAMAINCAAMCGSPYATAAEFDILNTPVHGVGEYVVDDAKVLSKASEGSLRKSLTALENETGFHLDVVTTRKLTFAADAYEFADKTIENWYPTKELGDKKGLLLVVTSGKEGAVVGGPSFVKYAGATGDSVAGESIPFYGDKELWNEAVLSSVKRIETVLKGDADPGPPKVNVGKAARGYKTKEETEEKKFNFSTAVVGLLVIAFVAPMLQYFAYTSSDE